MSEHLLQEQFALLRAKSASGALRDLALRRKRLKALAEAVRAARREVPGAFRDDFARPEKEVWSDEIAPVLTGIRHTLRMLAEYSRPVRTARGRAMFQPRGVVLVTIDPSCPFRSALTNVYLAAAAGNPVMVKLEDDFQNVAAATLHILNEVFPGDEVLVTHAGLTDLLALPFDAIYADLPPDAAVSAVTEAARRRVFADVRSRGRNWCVVWNDAAVAACARTIVREKFRNAGQHGGAPDCLLVHREVKDELMLAIRGVLRKTYGDAPEESHDYARIADDAHYRRLASLLQEGRLVAGGEHHPDGRYIAPTVLDDLDENTALLREPVAGPILPVFAFETFSDVQEMVRRYPDAGVLSVFGAPRRVRKRFMGERCAALFFDEIGTASRDREFEDFCYVLPVKTRWSLRRMLLALPPRLSLWRRTAARWFAR